jgi:hypothetical protein
VIDVQGRCPACRGTSLFLGDGGHVTCRRLDCPGPCAADELLHGESGAAALATIGRVRRIAADLFVEGATHTHRNIGRQLLNALQPPEDGEASIAAEAVDGCTPACQNTPGIRGLLEHVGIDTTGRDITVAGRIVDAAPAHNAGPTVAEAAADDRSYWERKDAGEGA